MVFDLHGLGKTYPQITWVCTTGRRYKLFTEMLSTFKNTCKDLDLISKYIFCDDRSSDREYHLW